VRLTRVPARLAAFIAVLAIIVLGIGLNGQVPPSAPAGRSPFDGLTFREIGPATPSGRVDDFAVLERNPSIFYVATATGGVWKTVNQGRPSRRCSTTRPPPRSVTSRSPRTIPTSSGWARARTTTARVRRGATASTGRATAAGRGGTWGCARAGTSPASSSIPGTTTWCTWRPSAACGARAAIAASSRRPTAGSRGRACSSWTTTRAPPSW